MCSNSISSRTRRVVIVGAGPGGLAAALLLAKSGVQVTIVESRGQVGGRTSTVMCDGFSFDIGPTFFLYPKVLKEIFAAVGYDLKSEVPMTRLDPHYRLVFGAGGELRATADRERMERAIGAISPEDAKRFHEFISRNRIKLKKFLPFLQSPFEGWRDLARPEMLKLLPLLAPWRSLDDDLHLHFKDERIRLGFSFQSKYLGMSPFRCPSLFSILSFLEYEHGVFHPKGGCGAVTRAMARIAEELGVKILLNEPVDQVLMEGGKAIGVKTASRSLYADAVVVNADFAGAVRRMVPNHLRKRWKDETIAKKQYSCSTFMMYLGIDGRYDDISHHTIYLAEDYKKNLRDIEELHTLSENPSFYVQNACVSDSSLAPPGQSTLYLLLPVTHETANVDWVKETPGFRELALRQLEKIGITDIKRRIRTERITTPVEWQTDFDLYKGATFSMAHSLDQMLHLRPHNRFDDVERMYLVGGGTHPGSGLPVIFESARITSRLLLEDLKIDPQWERVTDVATQGLREGFGGSRFVTMPSAAAESKRLSDRVRSYAGGRKNVWNDSQITWARRTVDERLTVLKAARHRIAAMSDDFVAAISPELGRTSADTLAAEVLPLLAAGRFLEQSAAQVLSTRRLGVRGLPFWLMGVDSEIQRVPLGRVLVIGPANYPLFLPGVQVLQGLVAGNAVIWKPGRGGLRVAELFADAMYASGLPPELLKITDESVDAAEFEIASGVDKVFLTGSARVGQRLLKRLANTLTPCVVELSGCDAAVILPSAELECVVQALAFGMRLNQSKTCIAPRRVLLVSASENRRSKFVGMLQRALHEIDRITLPDTVGREVCGLLEEAQLAGATVLGDAEPKMFGPVLVVNATTTMDIARENIFAPVLSLIAVDGELGVLAAQEACPFGLTCSIFGDESDARSLAKKLIVGTVLINDLIVPTADPRVSFGGRRSSGFGVTRGAEGLLEMTAVRTVTVQRSRNTRHFQVTGPVHESLFRGIISAGHSATFRERLRGVQEMIAAARELKKQ